jgi:hypothetical protein
LGKPQRLVAASITGTIAALIMLCEFNTKTPPPNPETPENITFTKIQETHGDHARPAFEAYR